MLRTFYTTKQGHYRHASDVTEKTLDGLKDTKLAYLNTAGETRRALVPKTRSKGAVTKGAVTKGAVTKGAVTKGAVTKGAVTKGAVTKATDNDTLESAAIADWRDLANSASPRPNDWRRLGITLFIFGREGGMEALSHASAVPPSKQDSTSLGAFRVGSRNNEITEPNRETVPRAEENALWMAAFGTSPVSPDAIPARIATLKKLKLGWFENLAAARLYRKAGLVREADRAEQHAKSAAHPLLTVFALQSTAFLVGMLALFGVVISGAWRQKPRISSAPAAALDFDLPGLRTRGDYTEIPTSGPIESFKRENQFSYRARMFAFLAYLCGPILLTAPLALPRVKDVMKGLSAREDILINLALYVPIVALALLTLRLMARTDSQQGTAPTLRQMLAGLGWVSRRPIGEEITRGVLGYVMMVPVLVLASVVSTWIFRNVVTPEHPANMLMFGLHGFWDRLLLVIEAVVAAPIVEETMFRGLLYPALRERWGAPGAIALSAAIFAIVHPTMPGGFLPLWTIGSSLALAYQRRGSLVAGIVMHGIQNGMAMYIGFALVAK